MKLTFVTTSIFLTLAYSSQAVITLQTGFGPLVDEVGAAIPLDSSAFLIASTTDGSFEDVQPTDDLSPAAVIGGAGNDDIILGKVTLIDGGIGTFASGDVNVTLTGNLTPGDPVRFVFFSSNRDGSNPTAGARYGSISTGDTFSAPFVIPGDGSTVSLSNSDFGGGTYPTSLTVVPEPSSVGLLLMGMVSLFVRRRR